ncbi:hypothetical protein [Aurantimonas sp. A3-2-R12]|uniref:hypothetical protein n=1 Tax=Aurantimonas sp. A3-2-R12 TaxID=3114362 RepID=UPI002E1964FC|nr:hypothetical protein [Aurantimonas sp. A3-2-R12]
MGQREMSSEEMMRELVRQDPLKLPRAIVIGSAILGLSAIVSVWLSIPSGIGTYQSYALGADITAMVDTEAGSIYFCYPAEAESVCHKARLKIPPYRPREE